MAIYRRKGKDGVPFGSYRISIYRGIENGKKNYHVETFDGRIQDARKREAQLKNDVDQGKYVKPGKLTVGEFMDKWLNDWSKKYMRKTTHEGFEDQVKNHVKPVLGSIPLTSLKTTDISNYYTDRLNTGLSPQTVRHHRTMLHRAFGVAVEWGLLQHNPVAGSSKIKVDRTEMQTYTPAEVTKFLETTKDHQPDYYALFHTCLHTGLRRSEVLGLFWTDINWMLGTIVIKRGLYQDKHTQELYYEQTKTAGSSASIPMTPSNYLVMQAHYERSKDICKQCNITWSDDRPVFCDIVTAKPFRPNSITRAWSIISEKAKLKHIRLHDSRHTHATILLNENVHPRIVQERLRHKSIRTTMDTYSHVLPSIQQAAAKSFDEAFKPGYNNKVDDKTDSQNIANNPLEHHDSQ